ncbi:DUF4351 domain-containing protein [Alkalinema pantanalense CENA528]
MTVRANPVPELVLFPNNSIDQLEFLGEALLDFESIDDLANWLNNQG